jgi:hypothetical protein
MAETKSARDKLRQEQDEQKAYEAWLNQIDRQADSPVFQKIFGPFAKKDLQKNEGLG